jgi:hypothetical protein
MIAPINLHTAGLVGAALGCGSHDLAIMPSADPDQERAFNDANPIRAIFTMLEHVRQAAK